MPEILLIGVHGQLAFELRRALATLGRVTTLGRRDADVCVDLAAPLNWTAALSGYSPDVIINAAAYTAVDHAEHAVQQAEALNALWPAAIAQFAARQQALLIHYSTDYVFQGNQSHPYTEDDSCAPLGCYGQSKYAGEQAVLHSGAAHIILRTAWIYGWHGHNFMKTMQQLALTRETLSVVNDQMGAPTWSRHIAQATVQLLLQMGLEPNAHWLSFSGIYHLSSAGQGSWFDFARLIIDDQCRYYDAPLPQLTAVTSDAYPTTAPRPAYSVLDNHKIQNTFGIYLPDWQQVWQQVAEERRADEEGVNR